jgi:hypothetical protein
MISVSGYNLAEAIWRSLYCLPVTSETRLLVELVQSSIKKYKDTI